MSGAGGGQTLTERARHGIQITASAQYVAWQRADPPPVERLTGGIWSIPLPMAADPLRYVLCYVLETSAGPVVIDPGWPSEAGWQMLAQTLERMGAEIADVHGIIVSHAHTDHLGMVSRLRTAARCWVGMHWRDAGLLQRYADGEAARQHNGPFLALAGVPSAERGPLTVNAERLRGLASARPDRILVDGDVVVAESGLRVIETPGHTAGHIAMLEPRTSTLFSADHLLPRITSNIGAYRVDGENPLQDYLDSLGRLRRELPADTEILPGHEYRFRGIAERVAAVQDHHDERLAEIIATVQRLGRATTWDVARSIGWSRPWAQTTGYRRRLAIAETLAHLLYLRAEDVVFATGDEPLRWAVGR